MVWVYAWHRCSELQLALFCICLLERGAGLPWNPCNRFMSKIRLYVLVYWLTLQPVAIPPPAYSAFCLVYSVSAFLPLGISSFCRAWCKDIQLGTLPGRDQIKTCSITSLQHSEYCQEEMMCCDAWSKQGRVQQLWLSQDRWDGSDFLSNIPATAGSPVAGCSGPCPDGWRLPPCGQPVPLLIGTHGRTCLVIFTRKRLCFSLCLLTLV